MTTKKSAQANLENKKSLYLMIGFVMVLSLVYISLEWSREKVEVFKRIVETTVTDEPPVNIPPTIALPPPPPPPPIAVIDVINVVKDETPVSLIDFTSDDDPDKGVDLTPVIYGDGPVEVISDDPVIFAEIMPRFNGDVNEYLSKNINYPQIAIETYTQGKVVCQFVVNTDGSIENVEVVKSVDRSLDKEAIRVINSMPKWRPGIQNGKPVRVKFFLQVNFKLM